MRPLLLLLLLLFPLSSYTCAPGSPIAIPWRDVNTQTGSNSRGVFFNVGDNQEQGLRISTLFSVTRVHSSKVCQGDGTDAYKQACEGQAGSTLDVTTPKFNSSFQVPYNFSQDPNDEFINTQLGDYQNGGHIPIILDTATGSVSLGDYPLLVMSLVLPNMQRKSGIGMGRWSTLLDQLYDLPGRIPSKVWGFSQGSYSKANPFPGELVIGGINPAAFDGAMRNFTLTDVRMPDGKDGLHCPTQVLISDFAVTIQGKSHTLISDRNYKLFACIDPFQQSISMPESMMGKLLELTGATIPPPDGAESPKPLMNATSDTGIESVSITIRDDTGDFVVTIPGNEATNPRYGKLPDGRNGFLETEGNLTQLEFRNRSDNYPVEDQYEQLPSLILGGIFLSQQYLMVDYSRNMFGLAPAKYHRGVSNGEGLQKICDFEPVAMSTTNSSTDGVKIGLAVLTAVGWLVVVILSVTLFVLCRRRRTEEQEHVTIGGAPGRFGNYGPIRTVERHFSSISEPPKPPTSTVEINPGLARAGTSETEVYLGNNQITRRPVPQVMETERYR